MTMVSEKKRIDSLQALRALAFIGIFMVHSKIAWGWSRLGVSIFYALSGFLMTYVYWNREVPTDVLGAFRFSLKKIKKLYPLHIITMIAVVLIQIYILRANGALAAGMREMVRNILLNIFLVQSWYPDATVCVALNGVAWYLSVALFLYFLFPFILKCNRKHPVDVQALFAVMLIILQVVGSIAMASHFGDGEVYRWFMYCFPVFRVGDFFAGCVLGRFYLDQESSDTKISLGYTFAELALLAFSVWFSLWLGQPTTDPVLLGIKNWSSGYILMALAWIWVFVQCKGALSKLIANPVVIALGNISPQAFLIHYVVVRAVNAYMGLNYIPFTPSLTWLLFAAEFIVTIIICCIYNKLTILIRSKN